MRVEEGFFLWWFPPMPAVYHGPTGPVCESHLSHRSFHCSLSSSLYNILNGPFLPGRVLREIVQHITNFSARSLLSCIFFICKTIKSISKTE